MTWKIKWQHGTWALATLITAMGMSALAHAECDRDGDCGHGFVCEHFEPACPDIADYDCPTEPISVCVLAPCETDAECAEGMLCLASSRWECDESRENCGPVESFACGPRWQAECVGDADCGEGFRCIDEEQCGCRGSSGSRDLVDDGSTAPAPEPDCSCEPTGRRVCELLALPCEDHGTCPDGWQCQPDPASAVCGATRNEPTILLPDGDSAVTDACTDEVSTVCMPPSYRTADGVDVGWGAPSLAITADSAGEAATRGTDDGSTSTAGCQLGGTLASASSGYAWLMLALVVLRRRLAILR